MKPRAAIYFSGTTDHVAGPVYESAGAGTVLLWMKPTSTLVGGRILVMNGSPSQQWDVRTIVADSTKFRILCGGSDGGANSDSSTGRLVPGRTILIGATWDYPNDCRTFFGTKVNLVVEDSNGQWSPGTGTITSGISGSLIWGSNATAGTPCIIGFGAIWERQLSIDEMREWQFNPMGAVGQACVRRFVFDKRGRIHNRGLGLGHAALVSGSLVPPLDIPLWETSKELGLIVPAGSVTITPSPANMGKTAVSPTVVLGAVTVAPAAAAMGKTAVDPTVVVGGISVTPSPASMGKTAVAPTVIFGPITVTPSPAAMGKTAVDPTVVAGPSTITPSPATMGKTAVDPTVVIPSGVTVTPDPAAMGKGAIAPTVVLGAITVAPDPATMGKGAVDPTVLTTSTYEFTYNREPMPTGYSAGWTQVGRQIFVYLPPVGDGTGGTVAPDTEIVLYTLDSSRMVVMAADGERVETVGPFTRVGVVSTSDPNRPWRTVFQQVER